MWNQVCVAPVWGQVCVAPNGCVLSRVCVARLYDFGGGVGWVARWDVECDPSCVISEMYDPRVCGSRGVCGLSYIVWRPFG